MNTITVLEDGEAWCSRCGTHQSRFDPTRELFKCAGEPCVKSRSECIELTGDELTEAVVDKIMDYDGEWRDDGRMLAAKIGGLPLAVGVSGAPGRTRVWARLNGERLALHQEALQAIHDFAAERSCAQRTAECENTLRDFLNS